MIPLTSAEVQALAPGELELRAEAITGVQIDSRRCRPGDLFVAVGGGAGFSSDALERGAAATLLPDDAHRALAALAAAVRERSSAKVVGITGSTGKTSTKDILAALCRPVARTVASGSATRTTAMSPRPTGKSCGTTAVPPAGSASISSDFALTTPSSEPTSSRCAGPTFVTIPSRGRAMLQSSAIWPKPRIASSTMQISVSGSRRQRVSGTPSSAL